MHYLVQPRYWKGYEILYFAKNTGKNIGKKSKNLSGKYSQKLLNHAK